MMYKLQNGQLITPPKVLKGIIGYDRNWEQLAKDGWKPLIETGDGECSEYIEQKDHIELRHFERPYDYREARAAEYPPLGDVIDALLKAYEGDDKSLKVIITQRALIKKAHPKVQND